MTDKLSLSNVCKTMVKEKERFKVLQDISFSVRQGEILCILGPSGCGKTTLLRLIGGFDAPDSGSIEADGRPVAGPSPDRILIFQEFGQLFPWKTVMENVMYPLRINKIGRTEQERREIAAGYLELVALDGFFNAYPHTLSGGMKQKAALARALALRPSTLLMDEPFGSLDAMTRQDLQALLLKIWAETGVTILFVTHDIAEAIMLGDRIILMDKGPGRIGRTLSNGMKRPRDMASPEYGDMYHAVYSLMGSRFA